MTVPLFQIVEEVSEKVLISAEDIVGFFVGADEAMANDVSIWGYAREILTVGQDLQDIELRVIDANSQIIGTYHIGRILLKAESEASHGRPFTEFVTSFYGYTLPYEQAPHIWRRWASSPPTSTGEWLEYPSRAQSSWLHVAQNYWFSSGKAAKKYGCRLQCEIDGADIVNESGFFCALGETVNGPGGYFGSSLTALDDCLFASRGTDFPFSLTWLNSDRTQEMLGASFVAEFVDILTRHQINMILA